MSIEKMELVNVAGLLKDLDEVLLKCCQSECFHIEEASKDIDDDKGFISLIEDNPYISTLKRLYSLALSISYKLNSTDYSKLELNTVDEFDDYIDDLETQFSSIKKSIADLNQKISIRQQALIQLNHLKGLDDDFDQIFSCKYITVRFGKIPFDSYQKLSYYDDKPYIFIIFDNDVDYYWGAYFVPTTYKQIVDDIFDSLYFERVFLPDFIKGNATQSIEQINKELSQQTAELKKCENELAQMVDKYKDRLDVIFSKLKYLNDTFELRSNASIVNDKFYLVGFVPSIESKKFLKLFDDLDDVSVLINPPEADERLDPPTKLKNGKFASPFSMFVEMYGLPSYNGFNPTTLVAITYTLLFGIMFGDLGQGLVIAIAGAIIWKKKKNKFGQILTRIGLSSAVFGLFYGSVFGFEDLLTPLYHLVGLAEKPIDVFKSTNTILVGAISIGVVLIITAIILNIFINLKNKNYEKAIFGNNGVAGLVFYCSILVAGVSTIVFKKNLFTPLYIICLIVLPLLVMFFRVPLAKLAHSKGLEEEEGEGGIGNFIAENFFELFEILLSYLTNTMSFLRVGGFILSHAGMMLVVMTLAEGVSVGVSPIIIIIGNVFVMCMEGLIVGIQVLRLEFYEIFSRFYEGEGHAFEPVKVDYDAEIE